MGVSQSLLATAISALGLSLLPSSANAIALQYISSATDIPTLMDYPSVVAEARIGSIALNTFSHSDALNTRFNLKTPSLGAKSTQNQIDFTWSSGKKQPFSLTYDGSTVSYTVGGITLESKITDFFKELSIVTRATENGSSAILDTLKLKDPSTSLSISSFGASDKDGGLTIFYIKDIAGTFTLTGNATLSWTHTPSSKANVAYQIRVGTVQPPKNVPESSPLLGLTLSTLIFAFWNRHRS